MGGASAPTFVKEMKVAARRLGLKLLFEERIVVFNAKSANSALEGQRSGSVSRARFGMRVVTVCVSSVSCS
jgi:hypothetical protein